MASNCRCGGTWKTVVAAMIAKRFLFPTVRLNTKIWWFLLRQLKKLENNIPIVCIAAYKICNQRQIG
jgi:hypothetical protein